MRDDNFEIKIIRIYMERIINGYIFFLFFFLEIQSAPVF